MSTFSALGRGTTSAFKTVTADIPQSIGEMYLTDPYGFSMGDLNLVTDDPNHQEYKKHLNL